MRGIDGPRDVLRYLDSMKLDVIYTLHFLSIDRQVYDNRFGFFFGVRSFLTGKAQDVTPNEDHQRVKSLSRSDLI